MADPAVSMKDLLVAANVGTFAAVSGWAISIGEMYDKPDTQITIRNSGGRPSWPTWLLNFPSIQIMVRGSQNGYTDAYNKCVGIKDALLGIPSQDLNGDRLVAINAIGDINDLKSDENRRPMFSLNFALIIEPASGGYRESL